MAKKFWWIGLVVLVASGLAYFSTQMKSSPEKKAIHVDPLDRNPARVIQPTQPHQHETKTEPESTAVDQEVHLEIWQALKMKYGSHLEANFNRLGLIDQISGKRGEGPTAEEGFDPREPQVAIRRAREILEDLAPLLGVADPDNLGKPVARGDSYSARVFFEQTMEGAPLVRGGKVSLTLGPNGELVSLYSNFVPGVEIQNSKKMSSSEAQAVAEATGTGNGPKTFGGRHVLWVVDNEGYHSYEFNVEGKQIIVDAESGRVLSQRDRRKF